MRLQNRIAITFVIALTLIVAAGCSKTRKGGISMVESGFLSDYSRLSETDDKIPGDYGPRPKLRYINPDANWAAYKKVLVDPIAFLSSKDAEISREDVQILLDYFWAELRKELEQDYELVDSPQPATLRLTLAITAATERNVTLDTMSTYIPFTRALAELQDVTLGKPSFVGTAMGEARLTDAETGTLLLAAMDQRVGGKTFKDFDSWSDVRAAIDYWAKLVVFRLCLLRGGSDCKTRLE